MRMMTSLCSLVMTSLHSLVQQERGNDLLQFPIEGRHHQSLQMRCSIPISVIFANLHHCWWVGTNPSVISSMSKWNPPLGESRSSWYLWSLFQFLSFCYSKVLRNPGWNKSDTVGKRTDILRYSSSLLQARPHHQEISLKSTYQVPAAGRKRAWKEE
jgi:hypothetical protein